MEHRSLSSRAHRWCACLVACAALFTVPCAVAQTIGGDRLVIGGRLHDLLKYRETAARSKAEFNAQIADARKAFFATGANQEARAAAEKRFADMLYAKDLIYMAGLLATGTGQESQKRSAAMQLLTGGDIDGGIPRSARKEFDAWVDAMRTSLGARHPDQLLLVTQEAQLRAALEASADSYDRYRKLRDKFEIDRFTTGQSIAKARLAPGVFRLHEEQHGALDVYADMRADLLGQTRPLRSRLSELARNGQPVLRCAYGPKDDYADGTPQYEHVLFWFKQPPDGIDELLAADTARGMARLHTRFAREKCPADNAMAKAIFSGGEEAGRARAAKTPKQLEEEQQAAMLEAGAAWRAAAASERAARAERMQADQAAAERARQAQLDALEERKQAQRAANAERLQGHRDVAAQRRCASSTAQLERARAQLQAMPAPQATRYRERLAAMELAHAQRCGG